MIRVAFASSFKRTFRKRIQGNKAREELFWQKLEIFLKDPFDQRLRTHKLSGKLKDLWSFTVEYDTRVVFSFVAKGSCSVC